jgi:hypothetical protein
MSVAARMRGATRKRSGFTARVTSASICWVMRMVPSSAAIAEPTLPATITPVSTGPSSRTIESDTTVPISSSAPKRLKAMADW